MSLIVVTVLFVLVYVSPLTPKLGFTLVPFRLGSSLDLLRGPFERLRTRVCVGYTEGSVLSGVDEYQNVKVRYT